MGTGRAGNRGRGVVHRLQLLMRREAGGTCLAGGLGRQVGVLACRHGSQVAAAGEGPGAKGVGLSDQPGAEQQSGYNRKRAEASHRMGSLCMKLATTWHISPCLGNRHG